MAAAAQAPQHYLAAREQTWQAPAQTGGKKRENEVFDVLEAYFKEATDYEVMKQPTLFDQLYLEVDYKTNPAVYLKPSEPKAGACWFDEGKGHFREYKAAANGRIQEKRSECGIIPDLQIRNKKTGRLHFVEVKNQNDSGNAHERCGKYATDIVHHMKVRMGQLTHPISYIFGGAMVRKRKYILELKACYSLLAPGHLVMLDKDDNKDKILAWFNTVVRPNLD